MLVCKYLSMFAAAALFFLHAATATAGSILLGGIEDYAGGSALEGHGDYNDLMFQMTGNISVISPLASFNALLPNMVDESGAIFWGQRSGDGEDYNFGYCATGWGDCKVSGLAMGPLNYLARQGGGAPPSQLFQASGAVTIGLVFEMTSNLNVNTLGWYDPSHPNVLHQIFSGPDSAGASVTFTPSEIFALYSTNGFGQFYSSVASDNQQELPTLQHFAFLETAPVETPEPATGGVVGLVLMVAGVAAAKLRSRASEVKQY